MDWRRSQGIFEATRAAQARYWFEDDVRRALLSQLESRDARAAMQELGDRSPRAPSTRPRPRIA